MIGQFKGIPYEEDSILDHMVKLKRAVDDINKPQGNLERHGQRPENREGNQAST